MRNRDYFKGKKVTIVGLARSGLACANLLYDLGAQVWVSDNKDCDSTRENARRLKAKDIKIELGRHTEGFIRGRDLLVVSPGVPNNALPFIWAQNFKIPVISEIEVAWILCPATVIAVTGSNGKTTVTTLIGKVLQAAGKKTFLCGNIGKPFSEEVGRMKEQDYVSLEISSFQLEKISSFKPKISVMLNFTCNHLDRYSNIEEYLQAKKRIFMNQGKGDYLVLNSDDPTLREVNKEAKVGVLYFSQEEDLDSNQAAVLAVASILNIDKDLVLKTFREFKGINHRLEFVREIDNITFINDSKSTTADSTLWALKRISRPVVLIAGGKDKGVDYSVILDLARRKIKEVVLIGEAKDRIAKSLGGDLTIEESATLEEATAKAYLKAKAGDCVLLSPMCSSFDMFSNYEERGNCFKRAVGELANGK